MPPPTPPPRPKPSAPATSAPSQVAAGYQLNPDRLQVTVDPAGLVRGGTLTVTSSYQVPLDDLPTMGLLPGQLTLTAHHQEPIDPHKSR